jgi:hypothetical protein
MKDMADQMDKDIAIGWERTQFMDETTCEGIGFRVGHRKWIALWGQVVFNWRRWHIGATVTFMPNWGYGGGIFVHVDLLPLWLSFRLGID